MHPKSHTCHAKRRSQRVKSRACATPRTQSPRHGAANTARQHVPSTLPAHTIPTIPATCHAKRTFAMRVQNTPRTQSPRHSAAACPRHACGMPQTRTILAACHANATKMCTAPHAHAKTCLKHARSPQPATRTRQKCARTLAVHAAPQRERRSKPDSRTGPRFRKPRRGHPAAIIEEFRRLGRKIRDMMT